MDEKFIKRLTPKQEERVNKLLEKIQKETKSIVDSKYICIDKEENLSLVISEENDSAYYVGYFYNGNTNYIRIDDNTAKIVIEEIEEVIKENS